MTEVLAVYDDVRQQQVQVQGIRDDLENAILGVDKMQRELQALLEKL
jgi:hypothetical protein